MKTHRFGRNLVPVGFKGLTLAFLLTLVGLTPSTARPCGGLLTADTTSSIEAQRALVVWRAETIDVHVQLKVSGNSAAAMWLIPVPAVPELAVGDAGVFQALDDISSPQVILAPFGGGGGVGCGDDAVAGGANGDLVDRGLSFSAGGTVGKYTYEIVTGTKVDAITEHLETAGFSVPANWGAELSSYVEAGMTFVAAKLTGGISASEALEPLILTVPRPVLPEMVYPVAIGRLSSAPIVPIQIYQLSSERHRVVNYGSLSLDGLADVIRRDSTDYATALDGLTSAAGGRLVVTEFARDLRKLEVPKLVSDLMDTEAFYLTRSTARVPVGDLADMLLSFAADAPEEDGVADVPSTAGGPFGVLFALLALGLWALRGRRLQHG